MFPNEYQLEMGEIMEEFKEYHNYALMQEIRRERNKYNELYEVVDKMFYDVSNQWEEGMGIEVALRELREYMYGGDKD